MKLIFHKIMSMLMTLVVLFSTMSFTMNMHYCGDTLVETAVFQKAEGCGMKMESPLSKGCEITKKNCCNDQQVTIEGQDELQLSFDKLTVDHQVFVVSFVYTYINLFEGLNKTVTTYEEYKPPLVIKQIYKIDETYLI